MTAGGQRRLVAGPVSTNVDHLLVYGSAGSIWASYKAGSGAWGNEVCISGSGSNHATPSVSWGGTYLPVVWRSGSSGNYSVLFNKRTSGSWLASPVSVASSLSSDPAPQIAFRTLSGSMTRRPHVAYRTSSTGITMRWSTDDGSSWSNSSSFTDNDGIGAYSLSAVNTLDDDNSVLTLGYISSMRAYVRDFQGSWGSRVLVPASEGENRVGDGYEPTMTDNLSLQVVRHESTDRTEVAFNQYQEYYNEQSQDWLTKYYQVVHTRDNQGTWGTATAYETSSSGTPSLSSVNGKFTMLWEDGGTLYKAQESQGTWGEPSSTGSGAEPALAVSSGTSTSSAHYVWRENASGLYKIVPSSSQMSRTVGPQLPAKRTSEGWVYRRVITMIDTVTGGIFSATASLPSVAGRALPLKAVNDTLPGINAMSFFSFMEPAPFTAESGDSLTYELTFATSRWPKDAGMVALQAGLMTNRRSQPVADRSVDLTRKSQPLRLKVPLGAFTESPVRLDLAGSLPERASRCVYTLTHVYAKPITSEPVVEAIPTQTVEPSQEEALAVYPNPFNPETMVGYRMKEGGWVKVSVYDL